MSTIASAAAQRTSAFLQEMGIGPLWTLRDAVEAAPHAQVESGIQTEPQAEPHTEAVAHPAPMIAPIDAQAPAAAPLQAPQTPPYRPPPTAVPVSAYTAPAADSAWGEDPPAPPATEEDIARMDWAELKTAIANCSRCGLCKGGRKPVYGNGAQQALWMVAAGATTAADEKERQPLAGDAGKLLSNMLAAVQLSRESNVYVTNLIKCRPTSANGGDRAPTADEALACRPFLERERALSGATMVLTLGQIAANALQGKPLQEPLAASRGQVHDINGATLVATLHPGELLRRGADKALAWADLCLARANDGRPG